MSCFLCFDQRLIVVKIKLKKPSLKLLPKFKSWKSEKSICERQLFSNPAHFLCIANTGLSNFSSLTKPRVVSVAFGYV